MFEPDARELCVVARADPDREAAFVDRLLPEIADPRTEDTDTVLVGVEAGERLAEGLADAVAAVGARHHAMVDLLLTRVKADRMVAGGEDDASDTGAARRLEHIVEPDD